jgi:hypothetical protein
VWDLEAASGGWTQRPLPSLSGRSGGVFRPPRPSRRALGRQDLDRGLENPFAAGLRGPGDAAAAARRVMWLGERPRRAAAWEVVKGFIRLAPCGARCALQSAMRADVMGPPAHWCGASRICRKGARGPALDRRLNRYPRLRIEYVEDSRSARQTGGLLLSRTYCSLTGGGGGLLASSLAHAREGGKPLLPRHAGGGL